VTLIRTRARWLIVETNGTGHRAWYVGLLLRELQRRDQLSQCVIAVPAKALATAEWQMHVDGLVQSSAYINISERIRVGDLSRLYDDNHLVITDGDRWLLTLLAIAIRRRGHLRGVVLLLRPKASANLSSRVASLTKRAASACLRVLSPELRLMSLEAVPTGSSENQVPDPVEMLPNDCSRDEWLASHDLSPARPIALLIGDLSDRKHLLDLLAAARHANAGDTTLVLVGRPAASLRESVEAACGKDPVHIRWFDGFVDDLEFDSWIKFADAVCVIHRNEGSSGVLLKAWAAGTPVLVGGAASVTDAARRLDCPRVEVSETQPAALSASLREVVHLSRAHPPRDLWEPRSRRFACALLGL
jgi:glycosyltransferase involved in cell wall biosynthesis